MIDDAAVKELDKTMGNFENLLKSPEAPDNYHGPLWQSWHFLQVYSTYGLRLPNTEATLKLKLGITDPGKYPFFLSMYEGYHDIHEASQDFYNNIFPEVIRIGSSLLDFAQDADPANGNVFSVLDELLGDDPAGALDLINDLQDTARKNATKSAELNRRLNGFKSAIESAQAKITAVSVEVEKNSDTSQATINKLKGGPEVVGSLLNLQSLLESKKDEYEHDVVVASTTVTYFWVLPPIGLIAAGSVAGVYGDKAVQALKAIDEQEANILAKDQVLNTAIQMHRVQEAAQRSLTDTVKQTALAIVHTTTVQNAWNGVVASLDSLVASVNKMTKENDEQTVLKAKAYVKSLSKRSAEKWAELVPPLKELTRDPYIVVAPGEKTYGQLADDIQKEIHKKKAA